MLIFYIVCGVVVFALSSFLFHRNRLAIYRRRIIRDISESSQKSPFMLSTQQEQKIKQCFLNGVTREECVNLLMSEH
ncbi:hypothetical protein [Psychromonas sp. 14N.309.X.WAT.B.A12]|uniref:hypothetical protein n=1 Tax=unclassified Psychromonas TaxID=2614957 RepID=UPI0025AF13BA|nr:hypothetical protein [Psychromonas sp. 14N.309.X.WAT.B.A12]MDN2664803.1 hypothetical protein [Psychromonas sp. 14N.309.X.WAT.B.A12]